MLISYFLLSLTLSLIFTVIIRKLAIKFNIVDVPDNNRKIHTKATPLLGGLAVFLAFFITIFIGRTHILSGNLEIRHWLGVLAGGAFLMLGGFLDDKYNLKPKQQLLWPCLAVLAVIIGGVEIEKISNPLGSFMSLPTIVGSLLIALWLMGMMYTTKLLDGVDGLVGGITVIGASVIFLFTSTT